MPFQTSCPSCDRPLRVPDSLIGQEVRCPGCDRTWTPSAPRNEVANTAPSLESAPSSEESQTAVEGESPLDQFRESPGGSLPVPPPPPTGDRRDRDEVDDDEEMEDRFERRLEERWHERRSEGRVEQSRNRLMGPAIGLMVASGIRMLCGLGMIVYFGFVFTLGMSGPGARPAGGMNPFLVPMVVMSIYGIVVIILGLLALVGAVKMFRMRSWGWSLATCIVTLIPLGECCFVPFFIGVAFSIWGIVILCDPAVKKSFGHKPEPRTESRERPDDDSMGP